MYNTHIDEQKLARRIYDWIELNYHINDYTLDECIQISDGTYEIYDNICDILGEIRTDLKEIEMITETSWKYVLIK